jgi:simple sugar transport system ATP-binding protein
VKSPADAIRHRIGMIHQHFMLVPTLTVSENVALGLASSRAPLTDLKQVTARIRALSERYRLQVHPEAYIWQLAVGERQRVEIIKALYRDVELLVLDEPTAVLTPQEVDELFVILRRMAADGRGLIFISHKLQEVMDLSHRITVLRNGKVAGSTTPQQTSREELARMMVGRTVKLAPQRAYAEDAMRTAARPVLLIEDLHVPGDRGIPAINHLSLQLYPGEILGIAGVSGNGQRELAEAITGLRTPDAGSIHMNGRDITGCDARTVRSTGIAFVPEERMRDGAIGDFSVSENTVLLNHAEERFCRGGLLRFEAIRRHCRQLVEEFQVKTPDIDTPTKSLSGGNIQKLIMARELAAEPEVLIAAQPTRGVDIGAAEYIHTRLLQQRRSGTAIMVISEDLDEVMALSDRIAVMYEGRILGIVERRNASREQLGLMMAGVGSNAAAG